MEDGKAGTPVPEYKRANHFIGSRSHIDLTKYLENIEKKYL